MSYPIEESGALRRRMELVFARSVVELPIEENDIVEEIHLVDESQIEGEIFIEAHHCAPRVNTAQPHSRSEISSTDQHVARLAIIKLELSIGAMTTTQHSQ